MGYGVIRQEEQAMKLVELGTVSIRQNRRQNAFELLDIIFKKTRELLTTFRPSEVAVEAPFYGKNPQSMLKLGRAQGVIIALVLNQAIPIKEYAPKKIKMAITGKGYASKQQVAGMLQQLLHFSEQPKHLDATDGLAVAVCHALQREQDGGEKQHKGWEGFIKDNPGRVKK